MTKTAKNIAEDLLAQAHHLGEQSIDHPEYKARNDAAEKEINELATLFDNDDVDAELIAEFNALFEDDAETKGWQGYKRTLESVGFDGHFDSAEDFLAAAILEMKTRSFA
ncbi:hypothetical protein O9X80_06280 [Agrobacterium salinitolerans]|uniref:hypothetical protein n=1 Tax=Agrobacterium salinitolerans TaxID=1183413 RepID=UPI0022B83381|nr:hypothetical protein [Agrobacterium salinitolerans]MCZ7974100.1 hypothetical protein [Agrobacterium salinitolerans]